MCIWLDKIGFTYRQWKWNKFVGTLFSKTSAHWFYPALLVIPGHWPWPLIMSSLSKGLGSDMQKTRFENSLRFSCTPRIPRLSGNRLMFWYGVFFELLSRPFDKIKITWAWGQWPIGSGKLGRFSCAKHLEKSGNIKTNVPCLRNHLQIYFNSIRQEQKGR